MNEYHERKNTLQKTDQGTLQTEKNLERKRKTLRRSVPFKGCSSQFLSWHRFLTDLKIASYEHALIRQKQSYPPSDNIG